MKNTYGSALALTIFGESHGAAIGAVLDGMAAGVPVDEARVAACMDKRRARRLSMQAATRASSTGTPAAMPSSTAPMAAPWLSPKMVSASALP